MLQRQQYPMPKRLINCLETVSTLVLLGSVTLGCASVCLIILYNMALVLLKEVGQAPILAALSILLTAGLVGYVYVAGAPPAPPLTKQEAPLLDEDPIHYEQDPM